MTTYQDKSRTAEAHSLSIHRRQVRKSNAAFGFRIGD